jgi:hypothetical protein
MTHRRLMPSAVLFSDLISPPNNNKCPVLSHNSFLPSRVVRGLLKSECDLKIRCFGCNLRLKVVRQRTATPFMRS